MMEQKRLDEIKARCEAATAGPWYEYMDSVTTTPNRPYLDDYICEDMEPTDADFIAEARQDIPDLLSEVERLRTENAKLELEVEISHLEIKDMMEKLDMFMGMWRAQKATNERLIVERDAALRDIPHGCFYCKHTGDNGESKVCRDCMEPNDNWEWRGPQNEQEGSGEK